MNESQSNQTEEAESSSNETESQRQHYFLSKLIAMAHLFAFVLCAFIMYISQPGTSLFSWHPTLMTLGIGLFMFEAILLFSPHSSLLSAGDRKLKVKYHLILQILAAVSMNLGFGAIFYNKYLNSKPHFTTWHGKIGFFSVLMTTFQTFAGWSLVYYNSRILNPLGTSLALRKKFHGVFGALVFVAGYFALVLSLYSNFTIKNTTERSWYFLLVLKTIMVSVVVNQVSAKYILNEKNTTK